MHIEFTNPGFEYMLNSIMEFQKEDVSSFWNDSLFYFFKELDKEYAYSLLPEKRREYFEEKMLLFVKFYASTFFTLFVPIIHKCFTIMQIPCSQFFKLFSTSRKQLYTQFQDRYHFKSCTEIYSRVSNK